MKARIKSIFECDKKTIIGYVNLSATLHFISSPFLQFIPVDSSTYPVQWQNGRFRVHMKLFHIIPFGRQYINIEKIKENDPDEYIIRDNGSGDIVQKWDHLIYISVTENAKRTVYVDEIEIKAGILTIFVWAFAHIFYRWRQYRWKQLIRNSFQQLHVG